MQRCALLISALLLACPTRAEPGAPAARAATIEAIEAIINILDTSYIDAGKARQLAPVLRQADLDKGTSGEAFARNVTQIMQDLTKDSHLRLMYSAEPAPEQIHVVAQRPGPGMWKVTKGEHVLWVFVGV